MTRYIKKILTYFLVSQFVTQVVRNFCNEDTFVVSAVKDEADTYRLVLRSSTCLSQQTTPSTGQDTSLDSSTEHS